LWEGCGDEFETLRPFVDHLNDAHTENKKGCDEFPCLWKVSALQWATQNRRLKIRRPTILLI
jgi:hypothetical protein